MSISVVINTLNEEGSIKRALESLSWADEVVIIDDGSTDATLEILRNTKMKDERVKIFHHKSGGYVEPARNFAISKASGDWILILDADEEIPETLAVRLKNVTTEMQQINYVEIPRKNIIFGKWMKASMWWPDYQIRFFKKGVVTWRNEIHSKPGVTGEGIKLDDEERWAIVHHNYESVYQFIERMNRYTKIQAEELNKSGGKFEWNDLIKKPLSEFLSRFFSNKGYKDGVHGLVLSLLQALSFVVVFTKVWEMEKFKEAELKIDEIKSLTKESGKEINYWLKEIDPPGNLFKRFFKN